MFVGINLVNSHKKIVVDQNWVKDFNLSKFLNYGPKTNKQYIVFFSTDSAKVAAFDLRCSSWENFLINYENNIDACYNGYVEGVFDTEADAREYIDSDFNVRILKLEKAVSLKHKSIQIYQQEVGAISLDVDDLTDIQNIMDDDAEQAVDVTIAVNPPAPADQNHSMFATSAIDPIDADFSGRLKFVDNVSEKLESYEIFILYQSLQFILHLFCLFRRALIVFSQILVWKYPYLWLVFLQKLIKAKSPISIPCSMICAF